MRVARIGFLAASVIGGGSWIAIVKAQSTVTPAQAAVQLSRARAQEANPGGFTGIGASPLALGFVPMTPCRAVDTRKPTGPLGGPSMAGGTSRDFNIKNIK